MTGDRPPTLSQRDAEVFVWSIVSTLETLDTLNETEKQRATALARWIVDHGVGRVAADALGRLADQDVE